MKLIPRRLGRLCFRFKEPLILFFICLTSFFFFGSLKENAAWSFLINVQRLDVSGFLVFVSIAATIALRNGQVTMWIAYLFLSGFLFFMGYFFAVIFPDMFVAKWVPWLMFVGLIGVMIFGALSILSAFTNQSRSHIDER